MEQNKNAVELAKSLLENGYKDVRFFDDLTHHPTVRDLVTRQKVIDMNQLAYLHPNQCSDFIQKNGYHHLAQEIVNNGFKVQLPSSSVGVSSALTGPSSYSQPASNPGSTGSSGPNSIASGSPDNLQSHIFQSHPVFDPNALLNQMFVAGNPGNPRLQIPQGILDALGTLNALQNMNMGQLASIGNLGGLVHGPNGLLTPIPQAPSAPAPTYNRSKGPLPEEIIECQKCDLKVNIIRHSYLLSHVQKHCEVRRFQCTQCTFASNESPRVINHMQQQHNLVNIFPITRSHEEIQPILDQLMNECFPNYQEQLNRVRMIHTSQLAKNQQNAKKRKGSHVQEMAGNSSGQTAPVVPNNLKSYLCKECRQPVQCILGTELLPDAALISHLKTHHSLQCLPWKCGECGYENASQWRTRRHIVVRHESHACNVPVTQPKTPNFLLFMKDYFIGFKGELPGEQEDSECEKLHKSPLCTEFLLKHPQILQNFMEDQFNVTKSSRKRKNHKISDKKK